MAFIITSKMRATRVFAPPLVVDYSGLGRGSVYSITMAHGKPVDVMRPTAASTVDAGVDFSAGVFGRSSKHTRTASQEAIKFQDSEVPELNFGSTANYSFALVFQDDLTGTETTKVRFVQKQDSVNSPFEGWAVYRLQNANTLQVQLKGTTGASTILEWADYPRQTPIVIVCTVNRDTDDQKLFGRALLSGETNEDSSAIDLKDTDVNEPLCFGNYTPTGAASQNMEGRIYLFHAWDRALLDTEARHYTQSPLDVYHQPRRTYFIPAAAAAGGGPVAGSLGLMGVGI